MDDYDAFQLSPGSMVWLEESLALTLNQGGSGSAFVGYKPFQGLPHYDNKNNANQRMMEFLKTRAYHPTPRISPPATAMAMADRSLKHKIRERIRRHKHNQIYAALHNLLPPRTKSDKKSILDTVTKEIEELNHYKEDLKRKEMEIKRLLASRRNENKSVQIAEVAVRVANPASGIDSMLQVLKCLKNTATTTTTTAIRSTFSEHEFAAIFEIETEIKATEVEKTVQKTLYEAEMKFRNQTQS